MSELLDKLVPLYGNNNKEMNALKKVCSTQNEQIKEELVKIKKNTYTSGDFTVKRTVSTSKNMNPDKLLAFLKEKVDGKYVKTIEVVDEQALERAIYNGDINDELLAEMSKCEEEKQTVKLTVSKARKGEEDDN